MAPAKITAAERVALSRACELAARAAGATLPNPVVGCVILREGQTVGEGFHAVAGGPHAEVAALAAAGDKARGATAIVTLEPCAHHGRTPPCVDALLAAGIARVVFAVADPSPIAAGGGQQLRAAGVDVVDLSQTPESAPARWVNRVWLTASALGRPYVTFKSASTLDGRSAAPDGTSQWITGEAARAMVHRIRAEVDTIMVGTGTVLADDPALTARPDGRLAERQPLRVVVGDRYRIPATAQVFDELAPTSFATAHEFPGPDGRVDLRTLLAALYERGQRHVLLEGGPRLAAAMLDAQLVDEIVSLIAPTVLGAGQPAVDGGAATTLAQAHRFELVEARKVGTDVVIRAIRRAISDADPIPEWSQP